MPTNIYDNTFPPDTQLANLLGQDIRTFKLDIQERMGAISGLLANRWDPSTDVQPLSWTGILYFATDTEQTFRWSGSAWVDVSGAIGGSIIIKNTTVVTLTTQTDGQSITIPANTFQVGSTFKMDMIFKVNSAPTGGNNTVQTLMNGVVVGCGLNVPQGIVPQYHVWSATGFVNTASFIEFYVLSYYSTNPPTFSCVSGFTIPQVFNVPIIFKNRINGGLGTGFSIDFKLLQANINR